MAKLPCIAYTRAGTARRSGRGLSMEIAGSRYFITPEDIPPLLFNRSVEVVDPAGEREGTAWLSPILGSKKRELNALIQQKLYVVGYRDLNRILAGQLMMAPVKEYHPL